METIRRRQRAWIFPALFLASGLYVLPRVDRGWVPHDEGTLAQPAARILLDGELPHRDFDDVYTGGQAIYHAFVLETLGQSLGSLRLALFAAFMATLPLLWYVGTRFADPVPVAAAVLLAVAWGIPVYPAAMPSWYNLFLAVAAVAAGLRYLETDRRIWLALAGACAGVSITVKVAGFYLLAALLLFVVHRGQELSSQPAAGDAGRDRGRSFSLFVTASLVLFVAAIGGLVSSLPTPATVFHFVLPPGALAGLLIWREWRAAPGGTDPRILASMLLPLSAGAAFPVAAFLAPYVVTGSVGDLVRGVFVLPAERFEMAVRHPPALVTALPLLFIAPFLVWVAVRAGRRAQAWTAGVLGSGLTALLIFADIPSVYRGAWWLIRPLVPVLVLLGLLQAALGGGGVRARGGAAEGRRSTARGPGPSGLFLLLSVTGMASMVQFPTAGPVYFFYSGALVALLGLALVSHLERPPWRVAGVLAAFHVAFAIVWIHPGWVYQMGDYYAAHPPTQALGLERGGIRVVQSERSEMIALKDLLDRVAPGPSIWATPDAPEVYFLMERRNPTRTLYDFFDEAEGRDERILGMLQAREVEAVVYNTGPARFSALPSGDLQRGIAERYPRSAAVGRFVVRWRGVPDAGPVP